MCFFPLASKTWPLPLLCTLYSSLTTLSGELVGRALCAAYENRLPENTSRSISELIVLMVSFVMDRDSFKFKHLTKQPINEGPNEGSVAARTLRRFRYDSCLHNPQLITF